MAVTFLTNEDREELEQMITEMGENIPDSEQNSDYDSLLNKPKINGVELCGNKTAEDLGIGLPSDEQVSSAVNAYLQVNPVQSADTVDKLCPKIELSGKYVTFSTVDGQPVQVTHNLPIRQQGEGIPSLENVRPITLYDGLTLQHSIGANLFGGVALLNKLSDGTGSNVNTELQSVTYNPALHGSITVFDQFEENTQYTIILNALSQNSKPHLNLKVNYKDGSFVELYANTPSVFEDIVFVTAAGKSVTSLSTTWYGGYTVLRYDRCGIFKGSVTVKDFEPYMSAKNYNVTFPEPFASGTFDWSTGKMSTSKGVVKLHELSNWRTYRLGEKTVAFTSNMGLTPSSPTIIGSHFSSIITVNSDDSAEGVQIGANSSPIYVVLSVNRGITTLEQFTTWLASEADNGTPVTVVIDRETAVSSFGAHEIVGSSYKNVLTSPNDMNVVACVDLPKRINELGIIPDAWGLPVLSLYGDITNMTKETPANLQYSFNGRSGECTCKWQGSSSLTYPKKNFTLKFDDAFEAQYGWGLQKKYCAKANFIDFSHARNVVSAKLWGEMVKRRKSPVSTYTEVFDLDSVTGWKNLDGADEPYAFTISNGVATANKTGYANGAMLWFGQQYDEGNYKLSFDYYCNGIPDGRTSEGVLCSIRDAKFKVSTNLNDRREIPFDTFGQWGHMEIDLRNVHSAGVLSITPIYSTGVQFKNISLKKKSFDGIFDAPNGGAIDGFPIIITINGEFQGLYTFNIPKDGWMFGMGNGTNEAILCADYSDASWFKGDATLDGDFDIEYASDENDTEWIKASVNRLINACRNSDGTDLDTTVAQYLDWESAIDYYILKKFLNGVDMGGKNYILATYDGVKWLFSAYDMDCTHGLDWDGKKYYAANVGIDFTPDAQHTVDRLIMTYKKDALKQRYTLLRKSVLSDDHVATLFANFIGCIPSSVYAEDAKRWPSIPNTSTNNLHQIVDYYCRRASMLDKQIETL